MSDTTGRLGKFALLSYPKAWRSSNGEIVLSTLSEVAEGEGRTAPRANQLWNVAATGLILRLNEIVSPKTRDVISTVALGSGTAFAIVFFLIHTWSPWAAVDNYLASAYPHFGPFINLGVIVYTFWAIALAFAVAGKHRAARYALVAALGASITLGAINFAEDLWFGPTSTSLGLLAVLSILAMIGTPRHAGRLALIVGVAILELAYVYGLEHLIHSEYVSDVDFWRVAPQYSVASVVAIGIAASIVLGIARRRSAATFALSSSALWALVFYVGALRNNFTTVLAQTALIVALVLIGFAARSAIRRSREPADNGSSIRAKE